MPIEEKLSRVSVDVYSVVFDGRGGASLSEVNMLKGVNASFRYNAGTFQMIVLEGTELESGVSIIDYSDSLDRIVVFYAYDRKGRLMEVMELGEFLDEKTLLDLKSKIENILPRKQDPYGFIIDSYQDGDDMIVKLLPTQFKIKIL
jgi:hypothetical protein